MKQRKINMQSNEQAKKIAIDYIDELCYYEKKIPDSLYMALNYFVDGIGVQRADCMAFFQMKKMKAGKKEKHMKLLDLVVNTLMRYTIFHIKNSMIFFM